MNLSNKFYSVLKSFEIETIKLPLSYNSKAGIRFDIGDSSKIDVYSKNQDVNLKYVDYCYNRANKILNCLDFKFDILAIQLCFFDESSLNKDIKSIISTVKLPMPEIIDKKEISEDGEKTNIATLLWDLSKSSVSKEIILKEIIKSDLGGENLFNSTVFWLCSKNNIIFNLYDDRGADLVAVEKSDLKIVYSELNDMILDYDKDEIRSVFEN